MQLPPTHGGMVRIRGAKEFSRKLERIVASGADRYVSEALFAAGETIAAEAQTSITQGAQYGKGHIASLPGEAPNADTHLLADNIEVVQPGPLHVEVSSNAPYSAALEFGTSKMAERPFMRPAVAKKRKEVVALIEKGIRRSIQAADNG